MLRGSAVTVSAERPGRWICVDGTEGAGKTTVTEGLLNSLPSRGINEFSRAPFGEALREAVRTSPHYISGSAIGQSLVFIGDFIELYETEIAPALAAGETVITDRGWLSKYAYQRTVLEKAMTPEGADELLRYLLGFIPPPDLTVLLAAPLPVIRARLLARDGSCDAARIQFIEDAAENARTF